MFPHGPIKPTIELFYGDSWHDITDDVRLSTADSGGGVSINRGRSDEHSEVDPGSMDLVLNNGKTAVFSGYSGVYSPRNPRSPLFGKIGRNTPIRAAVPKELAHSCAHFQLEGGRVRPNFSSTRFNTPNVLDVRVDIKMEAIEPETDQLIAVQIGTSLNDKCWAITTSPPSGLRTRDKRLAFFWSEDGSTWETQRLSSELSHEDFWSRRFTVRVTFEGDVSGDHRIVFYTGPTLDGPWTEQGEWNLSGTSSIHTTGGNALPCIASSRDGLEVFSGTKSMRGRAYGFEGRDTIGSETPDYGPDLKNAESDSEDEIPALGGFSSWEVEGAEIREPSRRFSGEVSEWPPRWDISEQDRWVEIEAAGLFRRLSASVPKPIESALFTAISNDVSPEPDSYWPMEDGENSVQARPVFGQFPMNSSASGVTRPDGRIAFAGIDATVGGSAPLPNFSEGNGVLRGRLNVSDDSEDSWAIGFLVSTFASESDGDDAWGDAIGIQTSPEASGDYDLVAIHFLYEDDLGSGSGGIQVTGETDPFGVQILVDTNVDITDGRWAWVEVIAFVDAGNEVFYEVFLNGESIGFGSPPGGSSIETTGHPREIVVRTNFKQGESALGHMVFRAGGASSGVSPFFSQISDAVGGHAGESAGQRVERLAELLGVNFRSVGSLDNTLPVGPQLVDTFLANIRFAEKADPGSVVIEDNERVGTVFITAESQLNQEGAALDYESGKIAPPLVSVDDDQRIINDFTAKRTGGSSTRLVQERGANNVQEPGDDDDARGRYATEDTFNVASDLWLEDIAGWQLHQGTWDEPRYPQLSFNFATTQNNDPVWTPEAISEVLALDTGSLMRIINTPEWLPPEDKLLLGQGYSEFIDVYEWTQSWNAIPGGPYEVAVLADDERGKRESTRTIMASDVADAADGLVLPGESGSYASAPEGPTGLYLVGDTADFVSTPDDASLDITGDIDIRMDVFPVTWRPGDDMMGLCRKYVTTDNERSWAFWITPEGNLRVRWSPDGSAFLTRTSTQPIPESSSRLAIRCRLDVDDGGSHTVTFFTASTIDGSWTQLGSAVTEAGTTSVNASDSAIEIGRTHSSDPGVNIDPFKGVIYAFQLRDGGTEVADPDFTDESPGTSSFTDDEGHLWTLQGDARISNLDITSDIDIRAEISPDSVNPDNGGDGYMIVAKYEDSTDNRSFRFSLTEDGHLRLVWSTDGTAGTIDSHESDVPIPTFSRIAVRVTLDVDDGGDNTATFYISDSIDGDWVQLGTVQTDSGTTSLFSGDADLEVGIRDAGTQFPFAGIIHAVEVRDGIEGTVVASPVFEDQNAGETSFDDDSGLTWAIHGDAEIGSAAPKMFPVSVLLGPRWTTDEDELGFDMMWHGERVTIEQVSEQLEPSVLSSTSAASDGTAGSFEVPVPDGVRKGTVILVFHSADVGSVSEMDIDAGSVDWVFRKINSIEPRSTCWMVLVGDDRPSNITLTQNSGADGIGIAVALNNAGHSIPDHIFSDDSLPDFSAGGNGNYAMGARAISGSGTHFTSPRSGPIRAGIELRFVSNEDAGAGVTWTLPSGFTGLEDIESSGNVSGSLAYQEISGGETGSNTSTQFICSASGSDRRGLTIGVMQSNQSLTVERSVNGIANEHSMGEHGRLFRPSVRALQVKDF